MAVYKVSLNENGGGTVTTRQGIYGQQIAYHLEQFDDLDKVSEAVAASHAWVVNRRPVSAQPPSPSDILSIGGS